jgi:3-dehydroquinate synthase
LAQELKLDRHSVLVAFGGGVCSDVVGFAASMIRRGIAYIRVPTTLVGQIDAGVGLKTGVNFRAGKNYLGSFHPPERVLIDPAFLGTLPARELRQGLAEMVKIALVRDPALFACLEECGGRLLQSRFCDPQAIAEHAIHRAIALMLEELGANPFENRTLERLVDMGHSFSPELESASGFTLPHGDAVAVDIALTCALAVELGMLDEEDALRIVAVLMQLGLPTNHELLDAALCRRAVRSVVLHRGGRLNLVVPTAIGSADFVRDPAIITDEVLERGLRRLRGMPVAGRWDLAAPVERQAPIAAIGAGA